MGPVHPPPGHWCSLLTPHWALSEWAGAGLCRVWLRVLPVLTLSLIFWAPHPVAVVFPPHVALSLLCHFQGDSGLDSQQKGPKGETGDIGPMVQHYAPLLRAGKLVLASQPSRRGPQGPWEWTGVWEGAGT